MELCENCLSSGTVLSAVPLADGQVCLLVLPRCHPHACLPRGPRGCPCGGGLAWPGAKAGAVWFRGRFAGFLRLVTRWWEGREDECVTAQWGESAQRRGGDAPGMLLRCVRVRVRVPVPPLVSEAGRCARGPVAAVSETLGLTERSRMPLLVTGQQWPVRSDCGHSQQRAPGGSKAIRTFPPWAGSAAARRTAWRWPREPPLLSRSLLALWPVCSGDAASH